MNRAIIGVAGLVKKPVPKSAATKMLLKREGVKPVSKKEGGRAASSAAKAISAAKAESQASALAVGARLRNIREQSGMSQRELAKRAGVTNATISLIEQESHAPSLASLHRILNAIPISMAEFFALPTSQRNVLFYTKDELVAVTRGAAALSVMGSERRDKKLQMFSERYAPGASTGEELIVHDGETAALVIQGIVELEVDGTTRRIESGGGFQLIGKQPYRLTNIGRSDAVVVCACTPSRI
jgi:transcriptional regulator with XRE-family HTH domain